MVVSKKYKKVIARLITSDIYLNNKKTLTGPLAEARIDIISIESALIF